MLKKPLLLVLLILWSTPLFAQSVDTAWVRVYNGLANYWDEPRAMKVNASGNVYVSGICDAGAYLTIKYDQAGNELWVRRYSAPGRTGDVPSDLALDSCGNVYVTGHSYDMEGGTGTNYLTLKYDPSGNELWAKQYNGYQAYNDRAQAIAVNDSGHVYVTGHTSSPERSNDYATIKYDQDGNELWVRGYNGPGNSTDEAYAIALDRSGNVYVTGSSSGGITSMDYTTVKYDGSGNELWVRRYDGSEYSPDYAHAIATDDFDNVYVTGSSGTIKYTAGGDSLWFGSWGGRHMLIDTWGNIYVATASGGDYRLVKYCPSGDTAWIRTYNGPAEDYDMVADIALDRLGNVYVTGTSRGTGTQEDYATVKYDPDGNEVWVQRYNGPLGMEEGGRGVGVDSMGNVYVTGFSWYSDMTGYDYVTVKYVQFLRADVNTSGEVNIVDAVYLVNYLFKSGAAPLPVPIVGDATCDSNVDINDVIYLINYLFKGGPAPCI